jgi:hypothetical protein
MLAWNGHEHEDDVQRWCDFDQRNDPAQVHHSSLPGRR